MNAAAGVALLRLAAFGLAAVLVGVMLATFGAGASQTDEAAGLERVQIAVLFFGPLAAIATLGFVVVLALTRPASLAHAVRRRAARLTAIAYIAAGVLEAAVFSSLWWALVGGLGTAVVSTVAWIMLHRAEPSASGG